MKRRLKEPFGKAGLAVAICALVLAMVGGAYAAGALSGKQKKEVEKIAKKYAGKPGAPGANGTNGAPGAKGDAGSAGKNGENGKPGESVTAKAIAGPGGCANGGSEFKVGAATTFACNGKNGETGFTEHLPSGKTETGTWNEEVNGLTGDMFVRTAISFPIPLSAGGEAVYVKEGESPKEGCTGSAEAPTAPSGKLCIYALEELAERNPHVAQAGIITFPEGIGYGPAGAFIGFDISGATAGSPGEVAAAGTWAVTG